MKELSIEEKAKRYDEAIKAASKIIIIHALHGGVLNTLEAAKAIAWLEKQAQKLVWSEEDKNMLGWAIGYLENKMLNTPISEERTACENAVAWLEEKLKGEQKPNPCDGRINRKGCINCENGELREIEQEPAWSEEDDRMYNRIVSFIPLHLTAESYTACINWFKSIKDRVQPQSRWKPTKKQIMALRCVLNHIPYGIHKEEISGLLDQIKEL